MENYSYEPVPPRIGGAMVIHYIRMPEPDVYRVQNLAIATYEGEGEYYLFECDEVWEIMKESEYTSADAAIEEASKRYDLRGYQWDYKKDD